MSLFPASTSRLLRTEISQDFQLSFFLRETSSHTHKFRKRYWLSEAVYSQIQAVHQPSESSMFFPSWQRERLRSQGRGRRLYTNLFINSKSMLHTNRYMRLCVLFLIDLCTIVIKHIFRFMTCRPWFEVCYDRHFTFSCKPASILLYSIVYGQSSKNFIIVLSDNHMLQKEGFSNHFPYQLSVGVFIHSCLFLSISRVPNL